MRDKFARELLQKLLSYLTFYMNSATFEKRTNIYIFKWLLNFIEQTCLSYLPCNIDTSL